MTSDRARSTPWLTLAGGDLAYKGLMAAYWVFASRTLDKAEVGILALGTALAVPVFLIIDAGFNQLLMREYSPEADPVGIPHDLRRAYLGRLRLGAFGLAAVIAAGALMTNGVAPAITVALLGACYALDYVTQMWLCSARASLNMIPDAIVRVVQGGGPLVALVALHLTSNLTIASAALTSALAYAAAAAVARREWDRRPRFCSPQPDVPHRPRAGQEFNAVYILRTIYTRADALLIQAFAGPVALANYTAASKLLDAARVVPGSIAKVVLADASTRRERRATRALPQYVLVSWVVASAAACFLALAGPSLISFMFGASYATGSADAIRVLALCLLLSGLSLPMIGLLLARARTRLVVHANALAVVTMVGAGLPLTHAYGITGAASALCLAELGMAVICALALRQRLSSGTSERVLVVGTSSLIASAAALCLVFDAASLVAAATGIAISTVLCAALVLVVRAPAKGHPLEPAGRGASA